MDDRQRALVPEWLERTKPRVEAEEAVEIDCGDGGIAVRAGPRNRDARARAVVLAVAERHDDAQAVDGAALKDRDELPGAPAAALCVRRARQERRREAQADQRERAVLEKDSA